MFDRPINIEHKQIPKYVLTADENYEGTQHIKRIFWYLAVLISNCFKNSSQKALNLVQNGNFSILSLIRRSFFVTIATIKFK